jgi:hypothetical protein
MVIPGKKIRKTAAFALAGIACASSRPHAEHSQEDIDR